MVIRGKTNNPLNLKLNIAEQKWLMLLGAKL